MRNFTKLLSFMLLVGFLFNSCRNPAYEINVLFDADVIKYKATVLLKDAAGNVLPNTFKATVTGTNAASIYDFSGTKAIPVVNNVITLGVTPKEVPTAGQSVTFDLNITGPGYEDKVIPVEIAFNQFSQIIEVFLLKTVVPTPATSVVVKEIPLSPTGATTTLTTFATPTQGDVQETTSISVPAGVQFKDAAGNTLVGGSVTAQAINFNADDPSIAALFPGGQLSAPNVKDENGNVGSAFFLPAGFTDIQMFVGGVEVKNFTTPITVGIQLNPDFMPSSGIPLVAGDQMPVYYYQTETGQFTYHSMGTAATDANGKLTVNFQTNHLTIFIVGEVIKTPSCIDPIATFTAPWLLNGARKIVRVETVRTSDGDLLASKLIEIGDGSTAPLQGLPPFPVTVIVKDEPNGKILGSFAVVNPCAGSAVTIPVTAPDGPPLDFITLLLNVNCPGKGTIVVPNFDLFYKPVGAPNTAFVLLGTAVKGSFKTTNLKIGSSYDFRAIWGSQTKTVGNRPITAADMSETVGENDFLGSKSPNYNKMLLIEACKGQ
ncbi:MAG: hypothetical protein EOO92_08825 [Pedobacter sp.]|nr:MAG: hypothetical protein EOO92_08825 [Pedobacter sp.]